MKRLIPLVCLLLCSIASFAQSYSYIGVDKGLSHRHVYSIKKDSKGYMWFLTYAGADRFNGSEFKHYPFIDQDEELSSSIHLGEFFYTPDSTLWEIGPSGKVFKYNNNLDRFDLIYRYPNAIEETAALDFYFIDNSKRVWMSYKGNLHIYDYAKDNEVSIVQHPLYATTTITQFDPNTYAVGTTQGVYIANITNDSLRLNHTPELLQELPVRINQLYYNESNQTLVISTLRDGLYLYNQETKEIKRNKDTLKGVTISKIKKFSDHEVLLATDGAGIFKFDIELNKLEPFVSADYNSVNGMNSNNIKDLYQDDNNRIWIANYPTSITVHNSKIPSYEWIKHITNNEQSLVHDEVNAIIEDSDGDYWFATTNGISLYNSKTKRWRSFLSTHNPEYTIQNHMFISLCEVKPGLIWAGGYNSGIYQIDKKSGSAKLLYSNELEEINQPDKYTRAIFKDSNQAIWIGDYYSLKQIDLKTERIRYFNDINLVTALLDKDESNIWVGTARGLYIVEKKSGDNRRIDLPIQSSFVYTLTQNKEGLLFIGTNNEGLLVFDPKSGEFTHIHKDNSSLITNNIRSLITDKENNFLFIATELGLSKLNLKDHTIVNWTSDQGLLSTFFNTNASITTRNGDFLFGSTNGVIWVDKESKLDFSYISKMVFEELTINQETILPTDGSNILNCQLDNTEKITLRAKQNNLSLKVGSINYNYPSNVLYSWKMEGLTEHWSRPAKENNFYFTHLAPGSYTLRIRAISREQQHVVLDEKSLQIEVLAPYWWGLIAKSIYLILVASILVAIVRFFILRNRKKLVDHTKQFYYNTAHDIKVPLRLIREPLLEIREKENLSHEGKDNIRIVLRNLNTLLTQNDDVINYDRIESNTKELYLSEQELTSFLTELIKHVQPVAELKQVNIKFNNTISQHKVWLDKDKISTILSKIINNAIEHTPDFKTVEIKLGIEGTQWYVEVQGEGEAISDKIMEAIKSYRTIDDSIAHSTDSQKEIGLRLIYKLVKIHKGLITIDNKAEKGTLLRASFPIDIKLPNQQNSRTTPSPNKLEATLPSISHKILKEHNIETFNGKPTLLLVENEREIQEEVVANLSDEFDVQIVEQAHKAIKYSKELRPDIIISKMHLEDMRGAELSLALKGNIETSHIPIILMTDSNDEKHIIKGLQNGADEYILKPFNYRILKASIANLLANRALLKDKYAALEIQEPIDCAHCATDLDWKFIATVKEKVEEHMSESDFTVDKLCAIMNMSRTSFYNKLKALTDQTPSDYIRLIKLNHATILLKKGENTIAEIAEITGFNDAKYFREVFKKHYHMTPSKYAKENK